VEHARAAPIARHRAHRAPIRHHCSVASAQDAGNGRIDFPISFSYFSVNREMIDGRPESSAPERPLLDLTLGPTGSEDELVMLAGIERHEEDAQIGRIGAKSVYSTILRKSR
jgi:hypothetical protein